MTTAKQGAQPFTTSETPQRIVVKSVNGHEPIKVEPSSSSITSTPRAASSSQLATPHSSPTKSNGVSSPTKSPGRPRRVEPIVTSSHDFGPSAGGDSDEESNNGESELGKPPTAKRMGRKSKADTMSSMSSKDSTAAERRVTPTPTLNGVACVPGNPSQHPVRKLLQHQSYPPLVYDRSQASSSSATDTCR